MSMYLEHVSVIVEDYDAATRLLAQRTGSVVVSVDYRLAPEYRSPGTAPP